MMHSTIKALVQMVYLLKTDRDWQLALFCIFMFSVYILGATD